MGLNIYPFAWYFIKCWTEEKFKVLFSLLFKDKLLLNFLF